MKLTVKQAFRDKETKKMYKPGDMIEHFEDTRAKDVISRKLAEEVKEERSPKRDKIDL